MAHDSGIPGFLFGVRTNFIQFLITGGSYYHCVPLKHAEPRLSRCSVATIYDTIITKGTIHR